MSDAGRVGERIADRYVLGRQLGAGGRGVVFRARDERLGRDVAIKVLPPSAVGDEQARRRLLREARAAAGLEHAGIVHVYDVGETPDGGAYLVMELVKGRSLRDAIATGALTTAERLAAIVEVGRALAFAHERGFVHRDIKPDNVMIREDARAVILDFGLAKAHDEGATGEAPTVTAKGTFVGTPAYMPPEQARGEKVDARADQFALAVTLFEAVTGQLPWKGHAALEIVSEILKGTPRTMREVGCPAPEPLEAVAARGFARDRDARYPTMGAFVDALEPIAAEVRGPQASPSGRRLDSDALGNAATVAASVSGSVGPAQPPATPPRGRRVATLGAGVALVAVAAAAWLGARGLGLTRPPAADAGSLAAAPLARAGAVLACPALTAKAHDFTHAEWLGAAAAHLVCERAQVLLGAPGRTRVPAELLALPYSPGATFPGMPFDAPDVHDKTVAAAASADAWVDGSVERRPGGFEVALVLRDREGHEAAPRTTGSGTTLLQAIRAAMSPLVESGAIPHASDPSPLRTWASGASIDAALAMHDLHVAILDENLEAVRDECAALHARTDLGAMQAFVTTLCADRLGEPLPPRPAADTSTLEATATSASILRLYGARSESDRKQLLDLARSLEASLDAEPVLEVRALRAAIAAEVHYTLGDADEAQRWALASIIASPREVDARGTAWHRLSFTSNDDRLGVLDAHAAWLPWEPFAYFNSARLREPAARREGAHRGSVLAMRGYWVIAYGDSLLNAGDTVAASAVAAEAHSPSLTVRVLRADGRLRGALDTAVSELARLPARPDTSLEAARLAAYAIELSAILEHPPAHMESFVARFLAPEPPVFSKGAVPFFLALSACMQTSAPVGPRCIARIDEMFRAGHFGAGYVGSTEALEGAKAYVAGDFAGAARAWRPLVARSSVGADNIRTPIADAFDRTGAADLADRVDAANVENPGMPMESQAVPSLALERSAHRALARGDCATAKRYAQHLIDKWELADEVPPAVDRMKKLIVRCSR